MPSHPAATLAVRPRLASAHSHPPGPVHVAQPGGVCLTLTTPRNNRIGCATAGLDAEKSLWAGAVPESATERPYCSTFRFRCPRDSDGQQVFWLERQAIVTASPSDPP